MIIIAILTILVVILRRPKIKGRIGEIFMALFLKSLPKDSYRVINDLLLT